MNGRMIIGWLILGGFLIIMADIPATSDLAVSFAFLIVIAVLLTGGYDAMVNLASLLDRGTINTTGGGNGGGGGRGRGPIAV